MKEFEMRAKCCKDCMIDPCCSETCEEWKKEIFKEPTTISSRKFFLMEMKYDPETGEVIQENEEREKK